jgi:phosphoglycerate dehydrogenase-like enzyme
MPRLLILLTLPPPITAEYHRRLQQLFPELDIDVADHHTKAVPLAGAADVLLTFGPMLADAVLAEARRLRWVQALGTGVDNLVDLPSLRPDVLVTNVHGIHGPPVSEAAMAAMLALSRNLPSVLANQQQHKWAKLPNRLLHGKTVGILGVGVIAEALAPKCKAFGMRVIGISSAIRQVPGFDRMYHRDELREAARELDYLVLLTPYSAATRALVDGEVFAAMKPTIYLVNLARGGVIDEQALLAALRGGRIAGAALDVFQQEPLPPEHPLWSAPNVLITPHVGGFCDVYIDYAMPTVEHNMRAFLSGHPERMRNRVRG